MNPMKLFEAQFQHERCQCSPNCPNCIHCDEKFELVVIDGKPAWRIVSKTIH